MVGKTQAASGLNYILLYRLMMDCIRVALSASKHHESQQADQVPSGFRHVWIPSLSNHMRFFRISQKFCTQNQASGFDVFEIRLSCRYIRVINFLPVPPTDGRLACDFTLYLHPASRASHICVPSNAIRTTKPPPPAPQACKLPLSPAMCNLHCNHIANSSSSYLNLTR